MGALFSRFNGPMLVVTAKKDSRARTESARRWRYYARNPTEVTFLEVDDDHRLEGIGTRVPVQQAIRDFIGQLLPLGEAIPLDQVEMSSRGRAMDYGSAPAVLISMVAGRAQRWGDSIFEGGRQEEFALTRSPSGAVTQVRSKVLAPLTGVPGFPPDAKVPMGWLVVSAAQSMGWPAIAVVGHQRGSLIPEFDLLDTLGNLSYIVQENPTEGTGAAVWRALASGNLRSLEKTPVVIVPGDQPFFDRTVLESMRTALADSDVVVGTARVENPHGKGRVVRDRTGSVPGAIIGIIEQKDIDKIAHGEVQVPDEFRKAGYPDWMSLEDIREVNTSVYAVRAGWLRRALVSTTNRNAQRQFYATELVPSAIAQKGRVTGVEIPAWKMMDVTRVEDWGAVQAEMKKHAGELHYRAGMEEVAPAAGGVPLDDRPIRAGLYPKERITYLHTINQAFGLRWSREEPGKLVFYPASGTDLFTPFLVADPEVVVMVSNLKLERSYRPLKERLLDITAVDSQPKALAELAYDYYWNGYAQTRTLSEDKDHDHSLIDFFLNELHILGVENLRLADYGRNYHKITFDWKYVGGSLKPRTLYFIDSTESADIDAYPQEVRNLIEERGVDLILQKGAQIQTFGSTATEEELLKYLVPAVVFDHTNTGALLFSDRPADQLALFAKLADTDSRMLPVRKTENLLAPFLQNKLDKQSEVHRFVAPIGLWGYAPHLQVFERTEGRPLKTGAEEATTTYATAPSTRTVAGAPIRTVTELKAAVSNSVPVPPASGMTGSRAIVATDEPGALAKLFAALALVHPEGLQLDILARNSDHRDLLLAGLEELGIANARVHDLVEFDGNRGEAIAAFEFANWKKGRKTLVVTALTGLEEVLPFLGAAVPESTHRLLEGIIERSHSAAWL